MQEYLNKIVHRKKILFLFVVFAVLLLGLLGRLIYLMLWQADYYSEKATELHERERSIKAARGRILDRNGTVIADNKTVCTISVIHNQIKDPEQVIAVLSRELDLSEETVRKRVEKYSSMERVKSNVDKSIGDRIREMDLAGVKVDEDYKRYYPYNELASKILGFTGSDNQGIIGLEVEYEEHLAGIPGTILTMTDAKGIEVEEEGERRIEPIAGDDLILSLDMNIQSYAQQLAVQAMKTKEAQSVSIVVMNPQNGEIMAMVNVPEFNLNDPFTLSEEMVNKALAELAQEAVEKSGEDGNAVIPTELTEKHRQDLLNQMWRNGCINDTYEPGSTFKIITAAAALEEGVVSPESTFSCGGAIMVEDRRIRCHKRTGHGAQNFVQATMNSCNPVFITVGLRLGVETYYDYFKKFGLLNKTGIDLPGEAGTIMHNPENMKAVELATVSFGQSFQITPIQLLTTVSSIINGGNRITPHLAAGVKSADGSETTLFEYPVKSDIVSAETSETMKYMLEQVVAEGGGKNGQVEGFRIGGKTATSQTLPRGTGEYISSFIGFAPADDPQVIAIAIVNRPQGSYYGSVVAAPIVRQLFENILPYLGIMDYNSLDEQ